jgi:hypothetical protein
MGTCRALHYSKHTTAWKKPPLYLGMHVCTITRGQAHYCVVHARHCTVHAWYCMWARTLEKAHNCIGANKPLHVGNHTTAPDQHINAWVIHTIHAWELTHHCMEVSTACEQKHHCMGASVPLYGSKCTTAWEQVHHCMNASTPLHGCKYATA